MKRHHSIVRIAPLSLAALLLVAGCGGHEDDHPHGPDGDHAHDGAEHAGTGLAEAAHADDAHDHGEGTHAHEAPETEAIYADDTVPGTVRDTVPGTVPAQSPQTGADATDAAPEESEPEAHTHGDGSGHEH